MNLKFIRDEKLGLLRVNSNADESPLAWLLEDNDSVNYCSSLLSELTSVELGNKDSFAMSFDKSAISITSSGVKIEKLYGDRASMDIGFRTLREALNDWSYFIDAKRG